MCLITAKYDAAMCAGFRWSRGECMRKISLGKHFTFFLIALLVFNSLGVAQSTQTQEMFRVTKVKASVQKRGIGEKSRVTVKLRNKRRLRATSARSTMHLSM
jgi:hypothetical protein